jgi:hypothetical protein
MKINIALFYQYAKLSISTTEKIKMVPVAVQAHNDELALLRAAHKAALDKFHASSKEDEVIALKAVTLAYRALKRKEAEPVNKVSLEKYVARVVEERNEQRINWNE